MLSCLSGLKDRDLSAISKSAWVRETTKDELLFKESDQAEQFFLLTKGAVKLFKTSLEGRELTVKLMKPGDCFCCASLYSGGRYHLGAHATERSELIVIPAKDLRDRLRDEIGEVGWKIIVGLCSEIRYLSNLIDELTFKDVEKRIINTLSRLADEGRRDDGVVFIELTHQDIASMTGTVREVVSRTLSRLKKEGAVMKSRSRGIMIDRNKLHALKDIRSRRSCN